MALYQVSITETVVTTYTLEIVASSEHEAQDMALDLMTNNADDEEFMEASTEDERMTDRVFIATAIG